MDKDLVSKLLEMYECELDMITPGTDSKHPVFECGLEFAFGKELLSYRKFLMQKMMVARRTLEVL